MSYDTAPLTPQFPDAPNINQRRAYLQLSGKFNPFHGEYDASFPSEKLLEWQLDRVLRLACRLNEILVEKCIISDVEAKRVLEEASDQDAETSVKPTVVGTTKTSCY